MKEGRHQTRNRKISPKSKRRKSAAAGPHQFHQQFPGHAASGGGGRGSSCSSGGLPVKYGGFPAQLGWAAHSDAGVFAYYHHISTGPTELINSPIGRLPAGTSTSTSTCRHQQGAHSQSPTNNSIRSAAPQQGHLAPSQPLAQHQTTGAMYGSSHERHVIPPYMSTPI
uniref:AT-hook motif nuclear-localized protein n=1 Tax=Macrostomum lignano TaxID=282301 RepID=A0A1I8F5D8_9PLAT